MTLECSFGGSEPVLSTKERKSSGSSQILLLTYFHRRRVQLDVTPASSCYVQKKGRMHLLIYVNWSGPLLTPFTVSGVCGSTESTTLLDAPSTCAARCS
jgi:hypothetical protein